MIDVELEQTESWVKNFLDDGSKPLSCDSPVVHTYFSSYFDLDIIVAETIVNMRSSAHPHIFPIDFNSPFSKFILLFEIPQLSLHICVLSMHSEERIAGLHGEAIHCEHRCTFLENRRDIYAIDLEDGVSVFERASSARAVHLSCRLYRWNGLERGH